ncbi:MAG: demethoxyubiquinone hydroxylase family protein [Pseudomonadota bacterium]
MAEQATDKSADRPAYLPGDRPWDEQVARMIRVDHAGEYGAARIYAGQLAILGDQHKASPVIRHMKAQEDRHLKAFDALVCDRRVRPSALAPLWDAAGFALGAVTALMGEKAAMTATAAVEEVIDGHYAAQLQRLGARDPELSALIADFQADEIAHRDTALLHGAADMPGHGALAGAIKAGCRAAIWLATRI